MKSPGQFVTFEGLDGCGKSTQLEMLAAYLRGQGRAVLTTREPGGTPVGQKIRDVLLNVTAETITSLSELSLMFAARAQHIEQVILPALHRGEMVLCDRFTDSSFAYQGYGRGVPLDTIRTLEQVLCQGLGPDLTLILDLDAAISSERTAVRNRMTQQPNTRFEQEGMEFFERVREGYLAIARQEPHRVRVIDARGSIEQLHSAVRAAVDTFLQSPPAEGSPPAGGRRGV